MTPQKIPIRLLRVRGNKSLQRFSSIEIGKVWDYPGCLKFFSASYICDFYIAIVAELWRQGNRMAKSWGCCYVAAAIYCLWVA
jgi:hypothetical protein